MRVFWARDVGMLLLQPALTHQMYVDIEGEALLLRAEDPDVTACGRTALHSCTTRESVWSRMLIRISTGVIAAAQFGACRPP